MRNQGWYREGGRQGPAEALVHWTQAQVDDQEERDLVLHSRAPGTWVSYTRWWQPFMIFMQGRGMLTYYRAQHKGGEYKCLEGEISRGQGGNGDDAAKHGGEHEAEVCIWNHKYAGECSD